MRIVSFLLIVLLLTIPLVTVSFAKDGSEQERPEQLVYEGLLFWLNYAGPDEPTWLDKFLNRFLNLLFNDQLGDFVDEEEIIVPEEWSDVG